MARLSSSFLALVLCISAGSSSCTSTRGQEASDGCPSERPRGSPSQLKTPIGSAEGVRIDAPVFCKQGSRELGAYLRVHGRGGTRRIVMEQQRPDGSGYEPDCVPNPGDPPEVCPEVGAMVVGATVFSTLKARGIEVNGIGAGPCAEAQGKDYETWRYSVGILDWKDADAAVAVVDEVLLHMGIGHDFGIGVVGVACAEAL